MLTQKIFTVGVTLRVSHAILIPNDRPRVSKSESFYQTYTKLQPILLPNSTLPFNLAYHLKRRYIRL